MPARMPSRKVGSWPSSPVLVSRIRHILASGSAVWRQPAECAHSQ